MIQLLVEYLFGSVFICVYNKCVAKQSLQRLGEIGGSGGGGWHPTLLMRGWSCDPSPGIHLRGSPRSKHLYTRAQTHILLIINIHSKIMTKYIPFLLVVYGTRSYKDIVIFLLVRDQ